MVDGTLYISTPFDQVIALDPATGRRSGRTTRKSIATIEYSEVDVARCGRVEGSEAVARLHRHDSRAPHRARCQDRQVVPRLRQRRTHRPPWRRRRVVAARLPDHLAAGHRRRSGRGRLIDWRQQHDEDRPRHRARVSTSAPAGCGGRSTRCPAPSQQPARRTSGASSPWIRSSGWSSCPTSSPSPDYFGGLRPGDNRHANSVVAVDAKNGEVVWHFQVVHHDLWDYDVAAQPMLVEAKGVHAVAVTTKIGHLFLLDRRSGKPLFPVEERAGAEERRRGRGAPRRRSRFPPTHRCCRCRSARATSGA